MVRANPSMPRSCTLVLMWDVVSGKRIPSYGVVNRDYLNALRRGRQWNPAYGCGTAPEQGSFPADGRLINRADGNSFGSPIAYVFIA